MLLTITTTHKPATDLGYLLHKHPERAQTFDLRFGQAHVFYPEATPERCTAALLLDLDTMGLKRRRNTPFGLQDYVNDRPYVASSFTSVTIARVFGSALKGQCAERPDLVDLAIPLCATIHVVPCRDGEQLLHDLFQPLGYTLTVTSHPLDEQFPQWGQSPYYTLTLEHQLPLQHLLTHLYVLIPVLDDQKHYFVSQSEIDTLLRRGEGWLPDHPKRDLIVDRYLRHQQTLKNEAFRLMDEAPTENRAQTDERFLEENLHLNQKRYEAVLNELIACGASRVLDLGCGDGRFINAALEKSQFAHILGLDISHDELRRAKRRLDKLPPAQAQRVALIHGSLLYRDMRFENYEAAVLVEVIEHIEPARLATFERVVFQYARPNTLILTTPNVEYNVRWPSLPAGTFRHFDHRFEWSRDQFQTWAKNTADKYNYTVTFKPIGPDDPEVGPPTQMAVFTAK